jgi:hypothetical protein
VVTGADGVAVFDALHRRYKATDAMLLLEFDGEDLRPLPLSERKAKPLARAPAGIVFNEHTGEDDAVIGGTTPNFAPGPLDSELQSETAQEDT